MPTKNDIFEEIAYQKGRAQDIIRRGYVKKLSDYTKNDVILYASAFLSKKPIALPPQLISISTADMDGFMSSLHNLKGKNLDLIIHSPGGSLEAVEQIVNYLRSKYEKIRAIIPHSAMSAATMLACACDSIIMGKHSALGPIDPQITSMQRNGQPFTAPAQAILDEFEEAKKEVLENPKTAPLWISKIQDYPRGFLKMCNDTISASKGRVGDWLNQYMFKDEKDKKGEKIAEWLGNSSHHKTHGRPINMFTAMEQGLKIEALEDDQEFQDKVLSVFHATSATFEMTNCVKLIENHLGKGEFLNVNIRIQQP